MASRVNSHKIPQIFSASDVKHGLSLFKEFVKTMRSTFEKRRDLAYELLKEIPDISVVKPKGAFYIFPNFGYYSKKLGSDLKFAEYLLEKGKVACVPGSALKDWNKLSSFLEGLSKHTLISSFVDLLTLYFNDKNSSKLRELSTLWIAGFEPSFEKLGYNGYRMNFATGKIEHCEVKPQNTENPKKKLNGSGSFNDYTPERFGQDLKENPTVLCSGFANGKLIYIFEFKFECLKDRLQSLLNKRFPNLKRSSGEYLRSASFSFKDYKACSNLRLVYLRENWEEFGEYLSKELINYFKRQKNEKH